MILTQKKFYSDFYCLGGELFTLLKKMIKLNEGHARFYAAQIVLALEHLHGHGIAYRDLKAENLLMDKDGYLRVADFGLSWKTKQIKDTQPCYQRFRRAQSCNLDNPLSLQFERKDVLKRVCGTLEFIAPEILAMKGYSKEVDLWALGVLIFQMLTGRPPFFSADKKELLNLIKSEEPIFPHYMSKESVDLVKKLLIKDPKHRLGGTSFEQIKSHTWFKEVDWELLYNKGYEAPFKPTVKDELDLNYFDSQFTALNLNTFYLPKDKKRTPSQKFTGFYFDDMSENTTQEELNGGRSAF